MMRFAIEVKEIIQKTHLEYFSSNSGDKVRVIRHPGLTREGIAVRTIGRRSHTRNFPRYQSHYGPRYFRVCNVVVSKELRKYAQKLTYAQGLFRRALEASLALKRLGCITTNIHQDLHLIPRKLPSKKRAPEHEALTDWHMAPASKRT